MIDKNDDDEATDNITPKRPTRVKDISNIYDLKNKELMAYTLNCFANHIETGNIEMSAIEAQNMRKPFKALNQLQMKLVVRLRDLAEEMVYHNDK